jgi:hypothetical protein
MPHGFWEFVYEFTSEQEAIDFGGAAHYAAASVLAVRRGNRVLVFAHSATEWHAWCYGAFGEPELQPISSERHEWSLVH